MYLWLMVGITGLVTMCAVLCAGLSVYQSVSASAPASHLPTPAARHVTPGAVVEWKRPTPTPEVAYNPGSSGSGSWIEPALKPAGTPAPVMGTRKENVPVLTNPTGVLVHSQPGLPPGMPRIRLPADAPLTQGFGCSPFYTGIPGLGCLAEAFWFHDGVDLGVPAGTPVQAGMAGTVIFAGPDGDGPLCNRGYRGYGLAVVVDSGDSWQTLYAHMSRIDVEVGQVVKPETLIGDSGDTGCVSGAHLHFGLRRDGELVDPMEFVQ